MEDFTVVLFMGIVLWFWGQGFPLPYKAGISVVGTLEVLVKYNLPVYWRAVKRVK